MFTDTERDRLKHDAECGIPVQALALLGVFSRLEAAERFLEIFDERELMGTGELEVRTLWRKSAGK